MQNINLELVTTYSNGVYDVTFHNETVRIENVFGHTYAAQRAVKNFIVKVFGERLFYLRDYDVYPMPGAPGTEFHAFKLEL